MLLKEKYSLNHLAKQKRFKLLSSLILFENPKADFQKKVLEKNQGHLLKNPKKIHAPLNVKKNYIYLNKTLLKQKTFKILNGLFFSIKRSVFLENFECFKYKKIHTYFRNIISDQKKRAIFAKDDLRKIIFKTLLSANQKSFLFISGDYPTLSCSFSLNGFLSMDKKKTASEFRHSLVFQKKKLKYIKTQRKNTMNLLQRSSIFKQKAIAVLKPSLDGMLGPMLFLEKMIYPQFTEKIKNFSRIRNRCLLSGRSSIVGKYRLSRIFFRYYANRGLIPGLSKK